MRPALVLAVDCSTTAAKAVAFDAAGGEVASATTPLALDRPGPGRHEQDAELWWSATVASLTTLLSQVDPASVRALCITHQRESFGCLDAGGRPTRPAILWLDSRASVEIAELGSDRVLAVSGKPPDTTPAIYKLAWLSRHEPSVLAGADRVVEVHAFLTERLTGRRVTSSGSADSLGLLDLATGGWSDALLAIAGVRRDQLPELVAPGEVIGPLSPDVARLLGLPGPIPLVAGIGDGQAAGLGAGAVEPGSAYLNLGTSMVLGTAYPDPVTGRAFRTLVGAPGFVLETVLNAAAYLTDWFRRELGDPAQDGPAPGGAPDPALEAAAARVAPGCEGLLTVPYWNAAQTPYWDPLARGAVVGWSGVHTRAHAYRSLLEGVAFELRLHLDGLEAATGVRVTSLRAMGGGSRSPLWAQIVADVTGRPLRLCEGREISARGAAVLAWAAVGPEPDVAAVSLRLGRLGATVEPRPDVTARYEQLFAVQRQVYPRLREVFADLAALQR